jgi:hypothetical protein
MALRKFMWCTLNYKDGPCPMCPMEGPYCHLATLPMCLFDARLKTLKLVTNQPLEGPNTPR